MDALKGAWINEDKAGEQLIQFVDGYVTYTVYSVSEKTFIETRGGSFNINGNELTIALEFDTKEKDRVGTSLVYHVSVTNDGLTMDVAGKKIVFKKLDNGDAPLAGVWQITSQLREGKIVPIHRTGTRKTLKILSGTHFQWTAIDPGTKDFFGAGGGTYTFIQGKYTEQIHFFSKDSSRIGASLHFDGKLENGEWHHSGFSSKGEPIYEIWSKVTH